MCLLVCSCPGLQIQSSTKLGRRTGHTNFWWWIWIKGQIQELISTFFNIASLVTVRE